MVLNFARKLEYHKPGVEPGVTYPSYACRKQAIGRTVLHNFVALRLQAGGKDECTKMAILKKFYKRE